ncbi:MAG: acetyl-CoA carboxylase biotin carboxylase subunit, partial [Myxococcota bacterium]
SKVLVANRGEIAVRVIRTLREMGIKSVAVFSDADRSALHVRMADEAYPIGPAESSQSYLNVQRLLEVCRRCGADAIHPGYGFLSENPDFVEACERAGILFIGPAANAMRAMGSKTAARARMIEAGVPVVPGAHIGEGDDLLAIAQKLGYPVMLKASAGGGGKGMRLVERAEEMAAAFERARSEAEKAFGDPTVYIEKAILKPRHVEIQILGDRHGNLVHLFERDCSIQRRHQKVVEETPSPAPEADAALVEQMGQVAIRAAQAVQYHGAGTVEFLLGDGGNFYFLEMNTRLQVEHPITEWITGIDLVREQIRVAAGEALGYGQDDVQRRGHAIECRVYAEDPSSGFLPSPGTIEVLRTPSGPGVRDDSGAYEGAEITNHYDPLVSKLSVWAPTRKLALERMKRALTEYIVIGPATNLGFHLRLMEHEAFQQGLYDTGFIEQYRSALLEGDRVEVDANLLAMGAAVAQVFRQRRATPEQATLRAPQSGPSAWRIATLPRQG